MAFIVALCSITYELSLAQTLSSLLGNTVLRYSLAIGLYLSALGLGAICHNIDRHWGPRATLFKVEILLSIVGTLAPFLAFFGDAVVHKLGVALGIPFQHALPQALNQVHLYGLILVLGFLSGFEIPLMLTLAEHLESPNLGSQILAIDYWGTMVGAVLFPLVLFPRFGLVGTAIISGLCNLVVAFGLCFYEGVQPKMARRYTLCLVLAGFGVWGLVSEDVLEDLLINNLFFLGE